MRTLSIPSTLWFPLVVLLIILAIFFPSLSHGLTEKYYKYLSYDAQKNIYSYNGEISVFELGSSYHKVYLNDRNFPIKGYFYNDRIKVYGAHFLTNQKLRKVERFNREGMLEITQYYNTNGNKIREERYNQWIELEASFEFHKKKDMRNISIFLDESNITVLDRNRLPSSSSKKHHINGFKVMFYNTRGDLLKTKIYDNFYNLICTYSYQYVDRSLIRMEVDQKQAMSYYILFYYHPHYPNLLVAKDYFGSNGVMMLHEQYENGMLTTKEYYAPSGNLAMRDTVDKDLSSTSQLFIFNENQEWIKKWTLIYSKDGLPTQEICTDRSDALIYSDTVTLNALGVQSMAITGKMNGKATYQYDSKSLLTQIDMQGTPFSGTIQFNQDYTEQIFKTSNQLVLYEANFNEEGNLRVRYYHYLPNGRIDEIHILDENGIFLGNMRYVYQANTNKLKAVNAYAKDGRITQSTRYDDPLKYVIQFNTFEKPVEYKAYQIDTNTLSFIDYLDESSRIYKNLSYDNQGKLFEHYETQYDLFDRKTQSFFYNEKMEKTKEVVYSLLGHPIKLILFEANQKVDKSIEYEYWDENQILKKAKIYNATQKLLEQFDYDPQGNRTTQTVYNDANAIEWVLNYTDNRVDRKEYYRYAGKQITDITVYNADDIAIEYYVFHYDSSGKFLSKEKVDLKQE